MSTLTDTLQPPPTEDRVITDLQQKVSASKLTIFQSCRLRFWFRYVLGLRKPKTPAHHVGVAVHAVLSGWNRARWRQQSLGLADLYTTYQAVWKREQTEKPVAWEHPGVEAERQQTGWRLLETFFGSRLPPRGYAMTKPHGGWTSPGPGLNCSGSTAAATTLAFSNTWQTSSTTCTMLHCHGRGISPSELATSGASLSNIPAARSRRVFIVPR